MRLRLAAPAAALAAVLVLGACAGGADPAAEPAGDPVDGGVLVVGENADEPTILDPHGLSATNTTTLLRPVFDTIAWQNADGSFGPGLATAWDVSEDGTVYTFTLREGVTFHDGAEWDAEGFKANLERIVDPETASPLAAAYIAQFESARVVDELTLEVTLDAPYSSFIAVLSQTYLSMISPRQIAEDPESIATAPIGSGPFAFESWDAGRSITLTRFDDYAWAPDEAENDGAAHLDGIEFRFIPEDSPRFNAVAAGDVDVIEWTPPQLVERAEQDDSLRFSSADRPGHPFSFWLNTSRAPFDDLDVRRALAAAIDRESIVDSVSFGQWATADGYVTPPTIDAAENASPIVHDVELANELLDDAGWSERGDDGIRERDGERLTATFNDSGVVPQTTQLAEQIQAQAREVGIAIDIRQTQPQEASDLVAEGDFDLSSGIWTTNTADVLWIQYSSENITTEERRGQNTTRLSDPELDETLRAAREATDATERVELAAEAQERIVELAPSIPLYVRPDLVTSRADVQGLRFEHAYGALWFQDVWLDR